ALSKYAHFTSPIRRYADVLVHRALIGALRLGADGLPDAHIQEFRKIGEDISATERRAMAAERESTDRYLALFLSDKVGETFRGRITGVTRFGLFAAVEPSGADGFIPMSSLASDYFTFDDKRLRLVGRNTRKIYRLGDVVELRLAEADRITGGLRFDIPSEMRLPANLMKKRGSSGASRRLARRRR
ncbi:MAG TPA: S1 RNA-binding domain-containing protein, partial [Sphingomonadales bacterium]|nr:S1 RNA-binding domain-containing protein [Sphingomonadales bacterium]